ncbi:MAG: ABC transporter substrate-binding protein [Desulfuromonadaceae bacterium]|nr:ABC transporter substrate-binding protein [Desulfuromonadaceae bacterium]
MTVLLLLPLALPAQAQESSHNSPLVQVQETVDQILQQLRTEPDSPVRKEAISQLIRGKFNFELMAQGALGPYWRSATALEQQRFVSLFSRLLEETYLGRIQAYTNETVRYGRQEVRSNRAEVETYIVTSSVEIPISYKLLPNDREWLVYDVVIEEVSLVRNYRSSYANILRSKGMEGLLEEMEQKLAELQQASRPKENHA